jgi:hypothetical protein
LSDVGTVYESRQVRVGYAEQATFITPIAVGEAFDEITCDPFDVDPDVMVHELPAQHGSQNPVEQTTAHSVVGSSAKFPVNGPVDLNDIDQFIYAMTQKVVEQGDTDFTKTFTLFTDHPDFDANGGHFLTFIKRLPAASTSQLMGGCIASRLKFSAERDGLLKFETDWHALGTDDSDADPSGTWTPRDGTGLVYFNDIISATLTKGASLASPVAVTLRSFEMEVAHEVEKLGHSAANSFEGFGLKGRNGSFKVNLLRDETADEAIISYKAGEMVQFDVDFGSIALTATGKIESIEYDDDGLLAESLNCKMLSTYTVGAVGEMLTVVVENAIDRSWPAA